MSTRAETCSSWPSLRPSTRLASTQISSIWSYSSSRGIAVFARDGLDCLEARWELSRLPRKSELEGANCYAGTGISVVVDSSDLVRPMTVDAAQDLAV